MNTTHVERWRSSERRGEERCGSGADGLCLGVRSYVEGGVVARGAGGRGASVGPNPSLRA